MKEIVVKFEPFVLKQTVFIKDLETGNITEKHIPQKELSSYLSLEEDLQKIHFFGNAKFAEKLKVECVTKYNMTKVEFVFNK